MSQVQPTLGTTSGTTGETTGLGSAVAHAEAVAAAHAAHGANEVLPATLTTALAAARYGQPVVDAVGAARQGSIAAAAAWTAVADALREAFSVRDAYTAVPDAGAKQHLLAGDDRRRSAPPARPARHTPRTPVVRDLGDPCPTRRDSGCPGRLMYRVGGGLACGCCRVDAGRVGLVDEPTDAAGITAYLRDQLGLTSPRSTTAHGVWNRLAVAVDELWVPRSVKTAMLGIGWACGTGRLPAQAHIAIGDLTDWQLCALIGEVAANCHAQGDVPVYLIRKYCLT